MKDKVVVVTGGAKGIGRAICLAFAEKGASIVVNYASSKQAADDTVIKCVELGARAIALQADVADAAQCEQLMQASIKAFGRIDVLVNNAGITKDALLIRMSEADFDSVIDTNLKGSFLCTKAVARLMMKQRYGRIINISSVVGVNGNAGQVNYAASKAGIIGMTKATAKELASRNITVNAVAPGFIETDMTSVLSEQIVSKLTESIPAARLGQPEDVAAAVLFLAGDSASYITGQVLCVDGGMAM